MNKKLKQGSLALLCASAALVHAGMVKDPSGNAGFDTLQECEAAVVSGAVGFYKPYTRHSPKMLNGAVKVRQSTLREALQESGTVKGYCSMGMGRKQGRNGVHARLQGKYIPLDAQMGVNVYSNRQGNVVAIRMAQCDNWIDTKVSRVLASSVTSPSGPVLTTQSQAPVAPAPAAPVASMPAVPPAPIALPTVRPPDPVPAAAALTPAPAASTIPWWALAASVAACVVFECLDNGGTTGTAGTTGTTGTTGTR